MHVYSKSIRSITLALAVASYTSAPAATVTLSMPKATAGRCSAYALCVEQGVLSVGRSPAGIYGFVTRPDGTCAALLLDTKLFARAKSMSGKAIRVEGVGFPRLSVADGVITSGYFDRTLIEGSCGARALVVYVTSIKRAS
jgi:hypothetical protein